MKKNLLFKAQKSAKSKISTEEDASKKESIVAEFCDFLSEFNKLPSHQDLKQRGISKKTVEYHFDNLTNLLFAAKKARPDLFMREPSAKLVQRERGRAKSGNILITCAVPGQEANVKFLRSMENYAKRKNVRIMIFPIEGSEKNSLLDRSIPPEYLITDEDYKINENLHIWNFGVKPELAKPLSGLDKFSRATSSIIVPSPKQIYNSVPNMSHLPRALIATGAMTLPKYRRNKSGAKAARDHVCGAYYVEVDGRMFFPRNIKALSDGSFIDLGIQYYPNGNIRKLSKKEIARVDGDDHAAQADSSIVSVLDDVQRKIPAGTKVSHDLWDQLCNNHHEQDNHILRAQRAQSGEASLDWERNVTKDFLKERGKLFDQIVVIPSNHNEALNRFNSQGRYLTDYLNWFSGHNLAVGQFKGVDPVKFATLYFDQYVKLIDRYFEAVKKNKKEVIRIHVKPEISNVRFLNKGESFVFGGYELGYHGSDGPNGTRGTPAAMSLVHGPSVTGHTHTPYLFGSNLVVGTGTHLPASDNSPEYARGLPSSWLNAFAFVYEPKGYKEGSAQLISIIDGRWCRASRQKKKKK